MQSDGVQIATLTRLWNAAKSLGRLRAAAGTDARPAEPQDPPLWGAYDFRILDVRGGDAFHRRHLPESAGLPEEELLARVFELPPKWRDLVVVSDHPAQAADVVGRLRERGWLGSVALIESLDGWPGPWESGPARRLLWEPTPLVRRWAAQIPRGTIIDLGCGAGRDAVYLAMLGHEVVAVDRLPDALEMATQLARRMGVTLRTLEADLRTAVPPEIPDPAAVLMIRFLRRELFAWAAARLVPGGLFLLETFTHSASADDSRPAPRRMLAPQEAWGAFCGGLTPTDEAAAGAGSPAPLCEILEYLETTDTSGQFVTRLVARKRLGIRAAHDRRERAR